MEYVDYGPIDRHFYTPPSPPVPPTAIPASFTSTGKFKGLYILAGAAVVAILVYGLTKWAKHLETKKEKK